MVELTKRLGRAEEALKKARTEWDVGFQGNKDLGREVAKKGVEIKKVRKELTKAQAFVTEYLMKEQELIRTTKANEEVESMRKA